MTAELQLKEESMGALVKVPSNQSIRGEKEEESDEYYSNSDSMEETRTETSWSDVSSPRELNPPSPKFSLTVEFLRRLHGSAEKGGLAIDDIEWQDSFLAYNDTTFPNDPTGELPNSWGAADSSSFRIRGETYLQNHKIFMSFYVSDELCS
ncbi:hypothetical protein L2E82_25945 [Cichorium intybus]|uniref:Uncharacterized protein n=1 Tax=Cichorium intybus TaxID=13427 RepID=A0ACB9E606_CICIN|nr:hypothetical protein L2E82_25945 [Cichorium intybus]